MKTMQHEKPSATKCSTLVSLTKGTEDMTIFAECSIKTLSLLSNKSVPPINFAAFQAQQQHVT